MQRESQSAHGPERWLFGTRPTGSELPRIVAGLNATFRHHSAMSVMESTLGSSRKIVTVPSSGAESVVILHMLAVIDRSAPVLFVDTEMHFADTLAYQMDVAERLGLSNVRLIRAARDAILARDPDRNLHRRDPGACCRLRKSGPLSAALANLEGWISGRRGYQPREKAGSRLFEREHGADRLRINPLAHWTSREVREYIARNHLPSHPLIAHGYSLIDCSPCSVIASGSGKSPSVHRQNRENANCGSHSAGNGLTFAGGIA